jgi:hypothetical protein
LSRSHNTINRQEKIMRLFNPMLAVALLVAGSSPAFAGAGKPDETLAAKAPAVAQVKPHSHLEAKGLGPMPVAAIGQGKPAKPLHDHRKEHK